MKGPKFNANLVKINQHTDENLARAIAPLRGKVSEAKWRMLNNVLRPFLHELNYLQEENADPIRVNESISSLCASLVIEYMHRTIPKGTGQATIHAVTVDFVQDITENLIQAVNNHYNAGLEYTQPSKASEEGNTIQ